MFPCYLLGCDEFPERKAAALAHFRERGVRVTYWRGYSGRDWGLRTSLEYEPGHRISPGHVGLNLGVWALWQHVYVANSRDVGADYYALFEDDVVLPENFYDAVDGVIREAASACEDWDLLFLGMAETEPHVWQKVTERLGGPDSRLCRLCDPFGTHALLVRRRALPVLLDNMTRAERNLDQQLWQRVLQPGLLKWAAVLPSLITQRTFDYKGTGLPEWSPSTIHASDPQPDVMHRPSGLDRVEAQALAGGVVEEPPGRPSPERIAITSAFIDPFPCIYRGEPMADHGTSPAKRSVPAWQCARFNKPCHMKPGIRNVYLNVSGGSTPVLDCEPCKYRTEMAPPGPRPRLPLPDGHFNPSMCMFDGRLILASRDSWGHSRVALWELKNNHPDWTGEWSVTPISSLASDHAEAPRLEDPRLFVAPGPDGRTSLHAMFNLPDGYPPKLVQVGYVRFSTDLKRIEHTQVYPSPQENAYEKNWVPFWSAAEREVCWVYATKPHHVVMASETWTTPNPLPWTGGAARGGASPVLVKNDPAFDSRDVYYHFFHGCLKRIQGSVYTVGCTVFEAAPPFRVLKQTPTPLLWPDLPGYGENIVKRFVVWPGGAVLHAGVWHLAIGIDDTFVRIVRLPLKVVEGALSDVPDTAKVHSIRDTGIALGVPAKEKS